ncbi:MAG: aspartate aminotransferase family protein [Deltaproteobacteria bacterium]|jgi:4-aminobutyrate aminotransferase / (S)-3-amino-2-methylpropionate transaminase / 5-aminovalerate transaminase|nr:aspartate aminotransferase family protein [Deltaproteobacteria bacterium]MBT4526657.1 aspartate aminotransferase family protein [Deltaproteobacteria bacterium]
MTRSEELKKLRDKAIPKAVFQVSPCVADHAKGSAIVDVDGNEWIDFSGGIGVLNAGHCPEKVVAAVKAQADRFLHTCFHVSMFEGYINLAAKMNDITPGDFEKKTFFANSGAEAVENGIKIARQFTGRPGVLCFRDAFHGRTLMGMSLTSKVAPYKQGYGPFAPEIYRVPFPYAYRMSDGDQKKANQMVLDDIKTAFKTLVDPNSIAAVIFEPVLGEGGFVPGDEDFFKELRALTQQYGILSICDEIQSGFGRTGELYAANALNIDYDIILSAKSMASGMPISAITGRANIMDESPVGGLGGTYGGNPLAVAAALATIEMFEEGELLVQAKETGEIIKEAFLKFKEKFPLVGDVRGLGAMVALELVTDPISKEPAAEQNKALAAYCISKRLSVITAGTNGNIMRILSPLNIDRAKLSEGLAIIEAGLESIS